MRFLTTAAALLLATTVTGADVINGSGVAHKREVAEALGISGDVVDAGAYGFVFTVTDGSCTRTLISQPQFSKSGKLFNRFSFFFPGFADATCSLGAGAVLQVDGVTIR